MLWLAGCLTWLSLPIFLPSRGPMIYVLGLFQLQQACNFYCKNMKCSFTTSKKASFLVFKTAFGFTVRCLDSSQFQHIDLGHITAALFCNNCVVIIPIEEKSTWRNFYY